MKKKTFSLAQKTNYSMQENSISFDFTQHKITQNILNKYCPMPEDNVAKVLKHICNLDR